MGIMVVFPGQGSQSLGMLSNFSFKEKYIIKEVFEKANDILGINLWDITQNNLDSLNQTVNTQPALLSAGYAIFKILQSVTNIKPVCMAGHSLGEYTALVAGGYLSFDKGLSLVKLRAEVMQKSLKTSKGKMAAILGLDDEQVINICYETSKKLNSVVEPANFNCKGQVVISGEYDAVIACGQLAKEKGAKKVVLLDVSIPSHCSLMKKSVQEFSDYIDKLDFNMDAVIPVLHNIDGNIAKNEKQLKQKLIYQLYQPVKWTQTIINSFNNYDIDVIVESGPAKVLTNLCKRINKQSIAFSCYDDNSLKKYEQYKLQS